MPTFAFATLSGTIALNTVHGASPDNYVSRIIMREHRATLASICLGWSTLRSRERCLRLKQLGTHLYLESLLIPSSDVLQHNTFSATNETLHSLPRCPTMEYLATASINQTTSMLIFNTSARLQSICTKLFCIYLASVRIISSNYVLLVAMLN